MRASHKTAIVRNSFSAVGKTACNITYTVEKTPLLRFLSGQIFPVVLHRATTVEFVDFRL